MPVKMLGRYEHDPDKEHAHRMLTQGDVGVDHVYGVELLATGTTEITFIHGGKARTAWAENDAVVHVMDGWDVLPPRSETSWRR